MFEDTACLKIDSNGVDVTASGSLFHITV